MTEAITLIGGVFLLIALMAAFIGLLYVVIGYVGYKLREIGQTYFASVMRKARTFWGDYD